MRYFILTISMFPLFWAVSYSQDSTSIENPKALNFTGQTEMVTVPNSKPLEVELLWKNQSWQYAPPV